MTDDADKAYAKAQVLQIPERSVTKEELAPLSNNWKDPGIPELQRSVVDLQLENLRRGVVDPVFASLQRILKEIELPSFTLLDAACATGYYGEVIRAVDPRDIQYSGCDYSAGMVTLAKSYYPKVDFQVQDLTALNYPDSSFDVVLVSGVLEHIPGYAKAIAEVCRAAAKYVILHRVPITSAKREEYTIGSQYTIETPRIYFTRDQIVRELEAGRFLLAGETDTYPDPAPLLHKLKSRVRVALRMDRSIRRFVKTMLFRRSRS